MLEAPADVLALSTTMALVPLVAATAGMVAVLAGNPEVISNTPIQPPKGGEEPIAQAASTDTNRKSFETLELKNSVRGEHSLLFALVRSSGPLAVVLSNTAPVKPTSY